MEEPEQSSSSVASSSSAARRTSPSGRAHPRAWLGRLFPGDRRVWRWSLVVLVPALAVIAYQLAVPRPFFTSSDSVGPTAYELVLKPHQQMCTTGVPITADTAGVLLNFLQTRASRISVSLKADGHVLSEGTADVIDAPAPPAGTVIRLDQQIPTGAPTRLGTVCVHLRAGGALSLTGFPQQFPSMRTTINGATQTADPSIYLTPPAGAKRSLLQDWSTIMHRVTIFRPGFAGVVFYWLLFILGLPLLAYLGIRTLAVARSSTTRRIALALMVISFLGSGMWALSTYAFDGPDESEHFAYSEYLAQTGHAPSPVASANAPYASDEAFALLSAHQFADNGQADALRPWSSLQERTYERSAAHEHLASDNGGGVATATAPHSPLYYALTVPGYELGAPHIFTELFWMRLTSALLATLIPLCAFLCLYELIPSRPELCVAGGLLIGFEPMVSFIGGVVNNDNGANAMAALAVYLTIRWLRRGSSWRLSLALGVVLALLPLMKGTGFALYPAVAVALLVTLWRRRSWATRANVGLVAVGLIVLFGIWGLVAHHFSRGLLPLPNGVLTPASNIAGGSGGAHAAAGLGTTLKNIADKLVYAVEVFVPHLPGFARHFEPSTWPFGYIYIERGFAAFGWVSIFFPIWVYDVVLGVMIASAVLALAWGIRRWSAVRRHWLEIVVLLLVILGVFIGVEYSYYAPTARLQVLEPEQGRYAFTALVPLAGLAVCGWLGVRRSVATVSLTLIVGAMIAFAAASHLLYLMTSFT